MRERLSEAMRLADEAIRYVFTGDMLKEAELRKRICEQYLFVEFEGLLDNISLHNVEQVQYLYVIFAELGVKIFDLRSYKKAVPPEVICNTQESFIELMKKYSEDNKKEYFRMLKLSRYK